MKRSVSFEDVVRDAKRQLAANFAAANAGSPVLDTYENEGPTGGVAILYVPATMAPRVQEFINNLMGEQPEETTSPIPTAAELN